MTNENFKYWLQGFIEIAQPSVLSENVRTIIQDHINLVCKTEYPELFIQWLNGNTYVTAEEIRNALAGEFKKITPDRGPIVATGSTVDLLKQPFIISTHIVSC